jgi:hypothetical protein
VNQGAVAGGCAGTITSEMAITVYLIKIMHHIYFKFMI